MRTLLKKLLIFALFALGGFFAYNLSTIPQIDPNPLVPPNALIGTWRDQEDHLLTLTSDQYWFGDDKAGAGNWRLDDWNLILSKNERYRVVRVDDRLEIIRGAEGGDLSYYPSFVRLESP